MSGVSGADFAVLGAVRGLMADFAKPWGIAGGWAIDGFVGHVTREHHDVDIAVWRRDQAVLRGQLPGWDWQVAENGVLRPWAADELLVLPQHEVHAHALQDEDDLEVLLLESEGGQWFFRRDPRVRLAEERVFVRVAAGFDVLNPAICLLFKAKQMREKDEADFANVALALPEIDRVWLREALGVAYPGHGWIGRL